MAILMLPMLLTLAIVFEGGRLFWSYQIATKAVRDGARYLSRVPDPTDAATQTAARNLITTGRVSGGSHLMGHWSDTSQIGIAIGTYNNSANVLRGPATIRTVAVTANVAFPLPFAPVLRFFAPATPNQITFSVGDQVRHYGQ
jgi:Flp pilus assembly protein TadG